MKKILIILISSITLLSSNVVFSADTETKFVYDKKEKYAATSMIFKNNALYFPFKATLFIIIQPKLIILDQVKKQILIMQDIFKVSAETAYKITLYNAPKFKELSDGLAYIKSYAYYDIDKDGVDELIINYCCQDDTNINNYVVYTFKNNTVKFCGNVSAVIGRDLYDMGLRSTSYGNGKGIFVGTSNLGGMYRGLILLDGTELKFGEQTIDIHTEGLAMSVADDYGIPYEQIYDYFGEITEYEYDYE